MAESRNIRYIPAVDHLRAFAAVLVLLYHSTHLISYNLRWHAEFTSAHWQVFANPLMTVIYEGHTGVALFLVLSGFIFTYGWHGREIAYGPFLLNRVLRIYPLMVALTFVGASVFAAQVTAPDVLKALLPLQNLGGGLQIGAYNAMFWTIAVEFQFYLIFPFLYRQLIGRGAWSLLPLLALLLLARWSAFLLYGNPRDTAYSTILGRLDQFIIGMIAADIARRLTLADRRLRLALPVGVIGVVLALWLFNHAGGWVIVAGWKILWPPVEGVLWAMVIVGYVAVRNGRDSQVSRWVANLGAISYSMYLTHFLVILMAVKYGFYVFTWHRTPYWCGLVNGALCVLPVTVAVSTLTYHAVEKPFLQLRRKYLGAPPPAPAPHTA